MTRKTCKRAFGASDDRSGGWSRGSGSGPPREGLREGAKRRVQPAFRLEPLHFTRNHSAASVPGITHDQLNSVFSDVRSGCECEAVLSHTSTSTSFHFRSFSLPCQPPFSSSASSTFFLPNAKSKLLQLDCERFVPGLVECNWSGD